MSETVSFPFDAEVHPEVNQTESQSVPRHPNNNRRRFATVQVRHSPAPFVLIEGSNLRVKVRNPNGKSFFIGPLEHGRFVTANGTIVSFSFSLVVRTPSQNNRERDALRRITIFGNEHTRDNFIQHIQGLGGVVKFYTAMELVDVSVVGHDELKHQCSTMRLYEESGVNIMHLENAQGETILCRQMQTLTLSDVQGEHKYLRHDGSFFFYLLPVRRDWLQVPLEANVGKHLRLAVSFIGDATKHSKVSKTLADWGATVTSSSS